MFCLGLSWEQRLTGTCYRVFINKIRLFALSTTSSPTAVRGESLSHHLDEAQTDLTLSSTCAAGKTVPSATLTLSLLPLSRSSVIKSPAHPAPSSPMDSPARPRNVCSLMHAQEDFDASVMGATLVLTCTRLSPLRHLRPLPPISPAQPHSPPLIRFPTRLLVQPSPPSLALESREASQRRRASPSTSADPSPLLSLPLPPHPLPPNHLPTNHDPRLGRYRAGRRVSRHLASTTTLIPSPSLLRTSPLLIQAPRQSVLIQRSRCPMDLKTIMLARLTSSLPR